ncbi:phosphate ABC transporter ATP-binding protein [Mycoplasma sp. NEAQ87857]|uniref:phosphate ABC transporter ATP-binding protein PstB n=1 Tax=Mycoplasma sp. NEAQ87857 TaxID=2683967 RepID=UPI001315CC5D|nr:phosphate ABC transporter ATP-binding protein PstB [Mycoplasma sp. NEAQ87857]QGZ97622.1 phosphate ABC transporter ATP-binding protein [Mycoplasma sp. NEAQ87857]
MQEAILKNKLSIKEKNDLNNNVNNCCLKEFDPNIIFDIRNFNLVYQSGKKALNNINLKIKENMVTAFIGPSGCGKSTLLKSLNKMHDLNSKNQLTGNMYFKDLDIRFKGIDDYKLRTTIGMVFQNPAPFPISIYENIAFALRNKGITDTNQIDQIVVDVLQKVNLYNEVKDDLNKIATELSGGQQQRLCIARVIALEPKVILMDEPTSALDPISVAMVEDLILELKGKYTIIIVTHSMSQAQRISDETVFLYKGEIIEHQKTRKLFTDPDCEMTKKYITGRMI